MPGRKAILGFVVSAALVVVGEAIFASLKVIPVGPELYARAGVDIEIRQGWRFGFLQGMHGARLVKIRDEGQSPRPPETDHARELHALMSRDLRQLPRKVVLETALYLTILGFGFFGAAPLRAAVRGPAPDRLRRLVGSFLPGALVFGLAAAPLLVLDYGYGGFSNVVGPGAISYSGPYFHWESWIHDSSNSISYRAFVSPWMLAPEALVEIAWLAVRKIPVYGPLLDDEPAGEAAYWIAGALFYGTLGALLIRRFGSARRRRERRPGFREARRSI